MIKKKTTYIFQIDNEAEDKLLKALKKNGRVKIGKFGIFELRLIKSRVGWNPITKEKKKTRSYVKVGFKPLKKLTNYVNKVANRK